MLDFTIIEAGSDYQPTAAVESVNGKTGVVVIEIEDIPDLSNELELFQTTINSKVDKLVYREAIRILTEGISNLELKVEELDDSKASQNYLLAVSRRVGDLEEAVSEFNTQLADKADSADLEALETTVTEKANTSVVNAIGGRVNTLENQILTKADNSTVEALTTTVNSKASKTELLALSTVVSGKASKEELSTASYTFNNEWMYGFRVPGGLFMIPIKTPQFFTRVKSFNLANAEFFDGARWVEIITFDTVINPDGQLYIRCVDTIIPNGIWLFRMQGTLELE